MARCHGTTKPPPPHARLHREHNAAATHGTRKDPGEISMLHPRKYVTMSCHASHTREATSARPAPPTETNKGVEPTREQGED